MYHTILQSRTCLGGLDICAQLYQRGVDDDDRCSTDSDEVAMIVFFERSSLVVSSHAFCFLDVILANKTRE